MMIAHNGLRRINDYSFKIFRFNRFLIQFPFVILPDVAGGENFRVTNNIMVVWELSLPDLGHFLQQQSSMARGWPVTWWLKVPPVIPAPSPAPPLLTQRPAYAPGKSSRTWPLWETLLPLRALVASQGRSRWQISLCNSESQLQISKS